MPVPPPAGPLHRRRSGRLVAGVAGGIADHLGVKVLWVRAAFVALMAVSGAGVLAYGLLWIFVRQEAPTVERPVPARERQQALGLAALGLGVGLAASALGNSTLGWVVGPLGVAIAGAAVVWREADEAQRRRWAGGARRAGGRRCCGWSPGRCSSPPGSRCSCSGTSTWVRCSSGCSPCSPRSSAPR